MTLPAGIKQFQKPKPATLIKVAIMLICLFLVYRTVEALGPQKIWLRSRQAHFGWLLAAVAAIGGRYAVWTLKWCVQLARTRSLAPARVFSLLMASGFLNLVTPSAKIAGGLFRAMCLRKDQGTSFAQAYGQVMVDQITHLLGNILLLGVLLGYAWLFLPQLGLGFPALAACLVCLLALSAWFPLRAWLWRVIQPGRKNLWRSWFSRYAQKLSDPGEDGVCTLFKPLLRGGKPAEVIGNDIFLSALSFAVFCYSNALVLRALGIETPLVGVALVVMLGYLAGTFLGVMGGIGVTELFLMKLYTMVGIPEEAAAAAAILHRGIYYLVMLLVGGVAFLLTGRKL